LPIEYIVGLRQGSLINNFVRVFYDPDAFAANRNTEAQRPARSSRYKCDDYSAENSDFTLGGELQLMT